MAQVLLHKFSIGTMGNLFHLDQEKRPKKMQAFEGISTPPKL